MAERVQLTGYQGPSGFRAEQAYDPSRQILDRGESIVRQVEAAGRATLDRSASDLEALSAFSNTLGKFLTDYQEKQNKKEYNLGLADVINGNIELPTKVVEEHNKRTQILREQASADEQVANQIEQEGNLPVAAEVRSRSRAISGWRAYGQAVGVAKKANSESQGFFQEFMDRTESIIPLPDGRLIAPAQASTPGEIQAALAVAQQEFIETKGLSNLNPVIIAEEIAPTLQAVKGQVSANHLSEITRKKRETAISELRSTLSGTFSDPDISAEEMSTSFQHLVERFELEGNLSKGAASDEVVSLTLRTIQAFPKELAEGMLERFARVPKIAGEPNSIPLGTAYGALFAEAADAIENVAIQRQQRLEQQLDDQAEKAAATLELARQDATQGPEALRALREQTVQTLGILADQGSAQALRLRGELMAEPENVDYTLYRQLREGINQGQRPSKEQLTKFAMEGKLTQNMLQELSFYSTESDRGDFIKQFGSSVKESVTAHLRQAGAISLNPFGQPLQHVPHVNQVINDLTDIAYKIYDAERQKDNVLDDKAINQLLVNQIPRVVGRYFSQDPTTKEWKTRPLSANPAVSPDRIKSTLRGYVPDVGGFNPRTIQLRNLRSGNSALPKAEVEDNIQRFQSGQAPTARMQALAATNPQGIVGALTHQAQHHGLNAAAIQNSPQAQQLLEAQRLSPRAAQLLATSPNYMGQLLQIRRIAEAKARRERQQQISQSPNGLPPGAQVGMKDYLRLGLQQGLDPEKAILMAAVGMAESTGQSSVINNNPQTGDLSYGLWQINMIGDLGPARLKQYGLRSADDLKDPETNARVMAQLLKGSGISAWGAYNDRRYLQYMGEARRAYAELKRSGGL